MLTTTSLMCVAGYFWVSRSPALITGSKRVTTSRRNVSLSQPAPSRPIYPYSIIRGGAYSGSELRDALERDPVAARHYEVFRRASVRTTVSPFSQPVFLSFRVGNAIYWTSRPVSLPRGETLLTDGENYARARCGNRISVTPQTPVNDTEPTPETLDTPHPPNVVSNLETWSENILTPETPVSPVPGLTMSGTVPPWWTIGYPGGLLTPPTTSSPPITMVPVIQPSPIPGLILPTPVVFPPTGPPPSPPVVSFIPPNNFPPETFPPAPIFPIVPGVPGTPQIPTESVPEPSLLIPTLLGIAAFAVTRLRRKR